jgi:hypothetical protein
MDKHDNPNLILDNIPSNSRELFIKIYDNFSLKKNCLPHLTICKDSSLFTPDYIDQVIGDKIEVDQVGFLHSDDLINIKSFFDMNASLLISLICSKHGTGDLSKNIIAECLNNSILQKQLENILALNSSKELRSILFFEDNSEIVLKLFQDFLFMLHNNTLL